MATTAAAAAVSSFPSPPRGRGSRLGFSRAKRHSTHANGDAASKAQARAELPSLHPHRQKPRACARLRLPLTLACPQLPSRPRAVPRRGPRRAACAHPPIEWLTFLLPSPNQPARALQVAILESSPSNSTRFLQLGSLELEQISFQVQELPLLFVLVVRRRSWREIRTFLVLGEFSGVSCVGGRFRSRWP
jgi:hypothetical protein